MTPLEKAIKAVSKLIFMTKEGKLSWTPSDRAAQFVAVDGTGRYELETAVETTIEGRRLILYEVWDNAREYDPSYVALVVCDSKGRLIWRFPENSALPELLDAARYTAGDVDSFLDTLIKT